MLEKYSINECNSPLLVPCSIILTNSYLCKITKWESLVHVAVAYLRPSFIKANSPKQFPVYKVTRTY